MVQLKDKKRLSKWEKAVIPDSEDLWTKEELLDVLYWLKQVVGVVVGVISGLIPLLGVNGNMT